MSWNKPRNHIWFILYIHCLVFLVIVPCVYMDAFSHTFTVLISQNSYTFKYKYERMNIFNTDTKNDLESLTKLLCVCVCLCVCSSSHQGCSQWAGSRWTVGPWRWWGQDSSCPSGCPDRSPPDCWCYSGRSSCGTSPGDSSDSWFDFHVKADILIVSILI